MVLVQVREFVDPELCIGPYPPPVNLIGVSEEDSGFLGDDELLNFLVFGYAWKIHLLEYKYVILSLYPLFKALLLSLQLLIVLLVLCVLLALVIVDILGLFLVIRVVLVGRVVVVVVSLLFISVHFYLL